MGDSTSRGRVTGAAGRRSTRRLQRVQVAKQRCAKARVPVRGTRRKRCPPPRRAAHLLLLAGMQPCWLARIIALARFLAQGNM
jgi:hypothetical protein